jgi:hypothetical protein
MELCGVRGYPDRLFKLRGFFAGQPATILLDSGASGDFIDPAYAERCGLVLSPSDRTIRLADGSIAAAAGRVATDWSLAAPKGDPLMFTSTFTATPLGQYDAILGMTWLDQHDPIIGWRDRSIVVRTPGRPQRSIKPLECVNEGGPPAMAQLATITRRSEARSPEGPGGGNLYCNRSTHSQRGISRHGS